MPAALTDFLRLSKLGEGSYSSVYKVKRIEDGQLYALKKVLLGSLSDQEKQNALNEVRIIASMRHPNIVNFHDCFLDIPSNSLCIVMEYVDDGDLASHISRHAKNDTHFAEDEIWNIFSQIIQGLHSLHSMKIMHRDLKSANIFKNKDGTIKLGDFNVSKICKQALLYTQTGTPYYASPEVWNDKPYDVKADIWSVGCIVYEMCTRKPPFRAQDMAGLFQKVSKGLYGRISTLYSTELSQIIDSMLLVQPSLRPSCEQLLKNETIRMYLNSGNNRLNAKLAKQSIDQSILLSTLVFDGSAGAKQPFKGVMPLPNYSPLKLQLQSKSESKEPQQLQQQQQQVQQQSPLQKISASISKQEKRTETTAVEDKSPAKIQPSPIVRRRQSNRELVSLRTPVRASKLKKESSPQQHQSSDIQTKPVLSAGVGASSPKQQILSSIPTSHTPKPQKKQSKQSPSPKPTPTQKQSPLPPTSQQQLGPLVTPLKKRYSNSIIERDSEGIFAINQSGNNSNNNNQNLSHSSRASSNKKHLDSSNNNKLNNENIKIMSNDMNIKGTIGSNSSNNSGSSTNESSLSDSLASASNAHAQTPTTKRKDQQICSIDSYAYAKRSESARNDLILMPRRKKALSPAHSQPTNIVSSSAAVSPTLHTPRQSASTVNVANDQITPYKPQRAKCSIPSELLEESELSYNLTPLTYAKQQSQRLASGASQQDIVRNISQNSASKENSITSSVVVKNSYANPNLTPNRVKLSRENRVLSSLDRTPPTTGLEHQQRKVKEFSDELTIKLRMQHFNLKQQQSQLLQQMQELQQQSLKLQQHGSGSGVQQQLHSSNSISISIMESTDDANEFLDEESLSLIPSDIIINNKYPSAAAMPYHTKLLSEYNSNAIQNYISMNKQKQHSQLQSLHNQSHLISDLMPVSKKRTAGHRTPPPQRPESNAETTIEQAKQNKQAIEYLKESPVLRNNSALNSGERLSTSPINLPQIKSAANPIKSPLQSQPQVYQQQQQLLSGRAKMSPECARSRIPSYVSSETKKNNGNLDHFDPASMLSENNGQNSRNSIEPIKYHHLRLHQRQPSLPTPF